MSQEHENMPQSVLATLTSTTTSFSSVLLYNYCLGHHHNIRIVSYFSVMAIFDKNKQGLSCVKLRHGMYGPYCQAQFQLASPMPVELSLALSLIITTHPTHLGK